MAHPDRNRESITTDEDNLSTSKQNSAVLVTTISPQVVTVQAAMTREMSPVPAVATRGDPGNKESIDTDETI